MEQFYLTEAWVRPVSRSRQTDVNMFFRESHLIRILRRSLSVRFPGAVDSKFTTEMSFSRPSNMPAMPTYRVMDSDGTIVDQNHAPTDVSDDEVISWYKNMLTGSRSCRIYQLWDHY